MTESVEQLCKQIEERQLVSTADLARLWTRWFRPDRADVSNVEKFGSWLSVNGYLSAFAFRMLRDGKADLLRLNQYQLTDHLASGPFAGAYLAVDPLQRRVVLEVLDADRTANPQAVQAFQVAAEQARSVRHPNVNLTLDYGEAQGRHYLVREFDEGETLADILVRRGRLQPIPAARLFALALAGLQALHEKQVPAGPLDPESVLLCVVGKTAGGKARTVKLLNVGVPRSHFDPAALEGSATAGLSRDHTLRSPAPPSAPRDDLFRLGISFYRTLTGQLPFPPAAAVGSHRAPPLRHVAPQVPEMLAQLVEAMIDADPTQRPRGAAQAAKSLRVFLASEEEAQQSPPEEQLVPHPTAAASAPTVPEIGDIPAAAEGAAEGRPESEGPLAQQFRKLWEELRPGQRDWVFLSIGAAGVILTVLLLRLLTGIRLINLVCLLAGGALSFFVERLLRLREE